MTDTTTADLPVAQEQAAPVTAPDTKPSLDELISKTMDDAEAPPDKGESDPPQETKAQAEQRARDEKGRFVEKNSASEASDTGATKGAQTAVTANTTGPAPTVQQPEPHSRWDDARKAKFSTLPQEAKQFALDVQAEHEANFTRKAQELSDYRRGADPLLSAVQPFQQYLGSVSSQLGMPIPTMINELLKTEYKLRTGTPEQKVQELGQLIHSYGIDLAQLIGGPSAQQPGHPGAQQIDPVILHMRQTNARLEGELRAIRADIDQQKQNSKAVQDQEVLSTIDAFASAKTAEGQPKHPHYERVKGVMSQILLDQKASNLEQAYEIAIAPINEAIAIGLASHQKAADTERQAAIEKAKKAAPVKSATGSLPNGAAKGASLDALIESNLSKAGYA